MYRIVYRIDRILLSWASSTFRALLALGSQSARGRGPAAAKEKARAPEARSSSFSPLGARQPGAPRAAKQTRARNIPVQTRVSRRLYFLYVLVCFCMFWCVWSVGVYWSVGVSVGVC